MKIFLLNVMLAFAWAALLGEFSVVNLVAGFGLGYLMLWVMQFVMQSSTYFVKVRQVIALIYIFTIELIKSNLRVAYSVIFPEQIRPGIVAIPLDIKSDSEITLLANMITLTPGTLSLDVSNDRTVLYVHGMHVDDLESFRRDIKEGFERRVQEAFQ